MEDIKIGRATSTQRTLRVLDVASRPVLGPSVGRTAILFCPPDAGTATFDIDSPAVTLQGIVLRSTDPPFRLHISEFGDLVQKAWQGVASAGNPSVVIFESYLSRE